MIDIKDLRLGNYVVDDFTNQCGKIVGINTNNESINIDVHGCNYELRYNQVSPVILTKYITQKYGFVEGNSKSFLEDTFTMQTSNAQINFFKLHYKDGWDICLNDKCLHSLGHAKNIKYLHELQNLFYDLTKTELNVQL